MTRLLTALLVLSLLPPVLAQDRDEVVGSGNIATETRKLAEFDEIELRISGNVHVTIGKATPLEIKADDNILPLIKTEVRDGRLVIKADAPFKTKNAPELKVTVAKLEAAEVRGSGDMHIRGLDGKSVSLAVKGSGDLHATGKAEQLTITVSGSGNLHATGKTEQLTVTVSGSGDVHAAGKTEQLTVTVSGSGDVRAFDLKSRVASVTVSGSGDTRVSVARSLNVVISGSGDVHYAGDPDVKKVITGSGDLKRRN